MLKSVFESGFQDIPTTRKMARFRSKTRLDFTSTIDFLMIGRKGMNHGRLTSHFSKI